jgi:hypothetical protein
MSTYWADHICPHAVSKITQWILIKCGIEVNICNGPTESLLYEKLHWALSNY